MHGAIIPSCAKMHAMPSVVRLVTFTELGPTAGPEHVNISALLTAEIDDGRGITLLDDRGWTEGPDRPDAWDHVTADEVARTARLVVGPDGPPPDRSQAEEDALHWAEMTRRLREHGVDADPAELPRLTHDVVIGPALRDRLAPG